MNVSTWISENHPWVELVETVLWNDCQLVHFDKLNERFRPQLAQIYNELFS